MAQTTAPIQPLRRILAMLDILTSCKINTKAETQQYSGTDTICRLPILKIKRDYNIPAAISQGLLTQPIPLYLVKL